MRSADATNAAWVTGPSLGMIVGARESLFPIELYRPNRPEKGVIDRAPVGGFTGVGPAQLEGETVARPGWACA